MLFVTTVEVPADRAWDLWALIWHEPAPPTLHVRDGYQLSDSRYLFIWDGESQDDVAYFEMLSAVGEVNTSPAAQWTFGWQQTIAGDVDGLALTLRRTGHLPEPEREAWIALCRTAREAPDRASAVQAVRSKLAECRGAGVLVPRSVR